MTARGEGQRRSEAARLEELWAGGFGDAYSERNTAVGEKRGAFWEDLLRRHDIATVLEVGCNVGANLQWISKLLPPHVIYGVDVNEGALVDLRARLPGVNAVWSRARELPFRDCWFDLVFTAGVLIHQPDETLPLVMSELVRCSRRYALCLEYRAEESVEVPYHGQEGVLFKRDYGALYQALFPELVLVEQGRLSRDEGWDDVDWWMFRR